MEEAEKNKKEQQDKAKQKPLRSHSKSFFHHRKILYLSADRTQEKYREGSLWGMVAGVLVFNQ